jgi:hypothetical protein
MATVATCAISNYAYESLYVENKDERIKSKGESRGKDTFQLSIKMIERRQQV